jgi:hypothetical protein
MKKALSILGGALNLLQSPWKYNAQVYKKVLLTAGICDVKTSQKLTFI